MGRSAADIFEQLSPSHKARVRAQLRRARMPPNALIIEEGELDPLLIIIEEGEVFVERAGIPVDFVGPGELIGEMAMFGSGTRSASVRAITPVTALFLERPAFEVLLAERNPFVYWLERQALVHLSRRLRHVDSVIAERVDGEPTVWFRPPESVFERIWKAVTGSNTPSSVSVSRSSATHALKGSAVFGSLSETALESLSMAMSVRSYGPGDFLCRQGDSGDEFYLVRGGAVDVVVATGEHDGAVHVYKLAQLVAGDVVGISALVEDCPRSASCVAVAPTDVLVLPRSLWMRYREGSDAVSSEVRRAIVCHLSPAVDRATEQLVSVTRALSGRPVMPRIGVPTVPPAPERREVVGEIFLDDSIGTDSAPQDIFGADKSLRGRLAAAAQAEVIQSHE